MNDTLDGTPENVFSLVEERFRRDPVLMAGLETLNEAMMQMMSSGMSPEDVAGMTFIAAVDLFFNAALNAEQANRVVRELVEIALTDRDENG